MIGQNCSNEGWQESGNKMHPIRFQSDFINPKYSIKYSDRIKQRDNMFACGQTAQKRREGWQAGISPE